MERSIRFKYILPKCYLWQRSVCIKSRVNSWRVSDPARLGIWQPRQNMVLKHRPSFSLRVFFRSLFFVSMMRESSNTVSAFTYRRLSWNSAFPRHQIHRRVIFLVRTSKEALKSVYRTFVKVGTPFILRIAPNVAREISKVSINKLT